MRFKTRFLLDAPVAAVRSLLRRRAWSFPSFIVCLAAGELSPFVARLFSAVTVDERSFADYLPGAGLLCALNALPFTLAAIVAACRLLPASVRLSTGCVPVLLSFVAHAGIDLRSDAQAGIEVILIPIYLVLIVLVTYAVSAVAWVAALPWRGN